MSYQIRFGKPTFKLFELNGLKAFCILRSPRSLGMLYPCGTMSAAGDVIRRWGQVRGCLYLTFK